MQSISFKESQLSGFQKRAGVSHCTPPGAEAKGWQVFRSLSCWGGKPVWCLGEGRVDVEGLEGLLPWGLSHSSEGPWSLTRTLTWPDTLTELSPQCLEVTLLVLATE